MPNQDTNQAKTIKDQVGEMSAKYGLDPKLVSAIITVESAWNPWAIRYEPLFKSRLAGNIKIHASIVELAHRNHITEETEYVLQSCSFGLMQIMGATARNLGFVASLPTLFEPSINLDYGCSLLKKLTTKYPDINDVISAYNAGSPHKDPVLFTYKNQQYVDKVKKLYS